jgi:hypothetical protein
MRRGRAGRRNRGAQGSIADGDAYRCSVGGPRRYFAQVVLSTLWHQLREPCRGVVRADWKGAGQLLRMFMCQIIERDPHPLDGWHPVEGGRFDDPSDPPSPGQMLQYAYGTGSAGPFALGYGYSLSARIHTVEAVFVNGDILQDDVADNVFALLSPHDTFPCELRAFAQDGRILCQFGRWRRE